MLKDYSAPIARGISFLKTRQLPSGEFATLRAKKSKMDDSSYVKSPFFTTFILHSLSFLKELGDINESVKKAADFLIAEKDDKDYWRFFGRNSYIPPDLDCTCCALSALYINGVELDYETIADTLLTYRNSEGAFHTWILDPTLINNKDVSINPLDHVVNANILFFYSLIRKPLPQVVNYLCSIIKRKNFHNSPYYDSPFSFIYCLTRAYTDGNVKDLQPILPVIKKYLLEKYDALEKQRDPLKNAQVAVSLINSGYRGYELDKAILNLIYTQDSDDGWPITSFFPFPGKLEFYGSRELNTAIALEALWKYQK